MATAYHSAGSGAAARPKSPHAYSNNRYFDDVDEFVSFGFAGVDEPGGGVFGSFNVAGFQRSATEWRASSYWADTNTTLGGSGYGTQNQLVFESHDRSSIFYARNNTPLFKYTSAGVKTTIGSNVGNVYVAHGAAQSATQALIVGGIELAQGWRARFVNLTTGAVTTATVSGLAWPTDSGDTLQYKGIVWSAALGKYIALLVSTNGDPNPANPNVNGIRLVTLEPTGASTLTATNLTLTGTAPTRMVLGTCLHFDPTYGVLLVATNPSQELQAIKVAR